MVPSFEHSIAAAGVKRGALVCPGSGNGSVGSLRFRTCDSLAPCDRGCRSFRKGNLAHRGQRIGVQNSLDAADHGAGSEPCRVVFVGAIAERTTEGIDDAQVLMVSIAHDVHRVLGRGLSLEKNDVSARVSFVLDLEHARQ